MEYSNNLRRVLTDGEQFNVTNDANDGSTNSSTYDGNDTVAASTDYTTLWTLVWIGVLGLILIFPFITSKRRRKACYRRMTSNNDTEDEDDDENDHMFIPRNVVRQVLERIVKILFL